jgi:hypothetical protein
MNPERWQQRCERDRGGHLVRVSEAELRLAALLGEVREKERSVMHWERQRLQRQVGGHIGTLYQQIADARAHLRSVKREARQYLQRGIAEGERLLQELDPVRDASEYIEVRRTLDRLRLDVSCLGEEGEL